MTFPVDGQDTKGTAIRKSALPAHAPDELSEQQEEATYGWWQTLWNKVRGHTASDARRLKEAAVNGVEGEAGKRMSEARKLDAEAQLLYAQAEEKRRDAALKKVKYDRQVHELQGDQLDEDIDRMERVANATERLANAISRIQQMGGDVAFDSEQLGALLGINEDELAEALRAHEETTGDN